MTEEIQQPFNREESLDEPGIIGARWWQRSLEAAPDPVTRRSALAGILVAGAVIAAAGVFTAAVASSGSSSGSDDTQIALRESLAMQQEYGWNFGAVTESLTFDGVTYLPFDRSALARLADDLRPSDPRAAAYYVPTLFQSPSALPKRMPAGDDGTIASSLKDALRPIFTPAMDRAYRRGRALASLFKARAAGAAVIVDLPGPESVAFAAGAAGVLDPVFLFDNWPHPRGVVPAHLALAAAAYYQPLFARHLRPAGAPPLFVLDRDRLNAYTDDARQFDNRHVARVPSAPQMKALGATRVLYVAPLSTDALETSDLNDDLVLYEGGGIDVKMVAADSFAADPAEGPAIPAMPVSVFPDDDTSPPRYYYGGAAASHLYFWIDYPWIKLPPPRPPDKAPVEPFMARPARHYRPAPRATPFSSGSPAPGAARTRPPGFGTVPVIVAVATGIILGAKMSRSGSWNRASSWGGG